MAVQASSAKRLAILLLAAVSMHGSVLLGQEASRQLVSMEDWPAWLVEAMARESTAHAATPVSIPDRSLSTEIHGEDIQDLQPQDMGWYLTSAIDAVTPVECWIFTSPVDRAATVRNITQLNVNASAKLNGEVINRDVFSLDSGMIGRSPYLALETLFSMGSEDKTVVGFVKVRLAGRDGIQFACSHNQVGFRQTFARVFEHFVNSATFEASATQPFLRQVHRQSLDGLAIGIIESTYAVDADGDFALTSKESNLIPQNGADVNSTDNYDYAFWKPDGALINQVHVSSENGQQVTNLNLQSAEKSMYKLSGNYQGQEVELVFEDRDGPLSDIELMLETQRMIADPARDSMSAKVWRATIDPTRFIETSMTFVPGGRDELRAVASVGPINLSVQLDEFGQMKSALSIIESIKVLVERIYREGQPPTISGDE